MGNRAGSRKRGFRGCMRPTDGNRRYLAGGLWSRGNKEAQTFLNVRRRTQSDPAPPVSSVCLQPHLVLLLPCSLNTSCLGGVLESLGHWHELSPRPLYSSSFPSWLPVPSCWSSFYTASSGPAAHGGSPQTQAGTLWT